ncbi:MAG: NAD-dependent epimerase/dehydratase [Caulobacter sp.]|nr:NAD-dependent epimerase/dehydratase [Caulobacter sp.]
MAETKTVLVTGGSGWLAGFCIAALLEQGYRVKTTLRNLAREAEVRATLAKITKPDERLTFSAADLSADAGWAEAVAGCHYVLHVASPFPAGQPKDPNELIIPAREGALRVLKAAVAAGVERVVLTSSVAAVAYGQKVAEGTVFDESFWTDVKGHDVSAYAQSKTIAEQAAWAFMKDSGGKTSLAVINPAAIIGPALSPDFSTSLQLVERLMNGSTPGSPRIGFTIVDVRDLAQLHLLAMTRPEAAGQRFIGAGPFLWMGDIAKILKAGLGKDAKVPSRELPDFMLRIIALFDPGIRSVVGSLGKKKEMSSAKAHSVLGWRQRPVEDTILDCARSLIAEGIV